MYKPVPICVSDGLLFITCNVFLLFHSLHEDLWESRQTGDTTETKRPGSERLSDTAQEIQGEEECGIPHKNLFPIFHGCLTINHDHIALFEGFFSPPAFTAWNQSLEK